MNKRAARKAIRRAHYGADVESCASYDFRKHTCEAMQAARGPCACIAADRGLEYLRRVGYPAEWIEASTTDPPIDSAEDEALRQRRIQLLASPEF